MEKVEKRRISERQQSGGRKNKEGRRSERKRCQCECDLSEERLSKKFGKKLSEESDEILYEITDEILSEKSSVKSDDIHLHLSDSDGSSVDVTRYHYK